MNLNDIRSLFLDFFVKKGHQKVSSSPLVLQNDPTLLFTNAGMVQFKNYFTGVEVPKFNTATSAQKCLRAGGKHNDLENVGYTGRHHTFFEMLGNFSFGDYFKEEAILYAWEFVTKQLALNPQKLYFTVYHEDSEAYNLWKKISGLSEDRIIKIDTSDNFWAMGDTGPCGPCSEIFYDYGEAVSGGLPGTPQQDGDRYVEVWNLVFMQYETLPDGTRVKLPKPCVDTGMGLERVASVMQGFTDNYHIDLFKTLIDNSKHICGMGQASDSSKAHRVVADHLRACSFLIADGVLPSNEGRGYVLRRIIRRAVRYIHGLGVKDIVFYKMVDKLVELMGKSYPELVTASKLIKSTLQMEEGKFRKTIDQGMKHLSESIKGISSGGVLDGVVAFKLYDTYGFPLDLTLDILKERGLELDHKSFEEAMQAQKDRARKAWKGDEEYQKQDAAYWLALEERLGKTEFIGYDSSHTDSKILAIIQNGQELESASEGKALIILDKTPFYAESGGQIGDKGSLSDSVVLDTQKHGNDLFIHEVDLKETLSMGNTVHVSVDNDSRGLIKANHSATHLLHHALRAKFGEHVVQKGSLVDDIKLRFDFTHQSAITQEELHDVEMSVNKMIFSNFSISVKKMPRDDAMKQGAMALFGEKYQDEVRVVSMGSSVELCGGTHVNDTSEIGVFKIISEESISSGVRRIVAITGVKAMQYCNSQINILGDVAKHLKVGVNDLKDNIIQLQGKVSDLNKKLEKFQIEAIIQALDVPVKVGNEDFIFVQFSDIEPKLYKPLVEKISQKYIDTNVICIFKVYEKLSIIAKAFKNSNIFDAGNFVKSLCELIGGRGGGSKYFAQGGCALNSEVMKLSNKELRQKIVELLSAK